MRRFILAFLVLLVGSHYSVYSQTNQTDLLKALLDLPAPPPFDKEVEVETTDDAYGQDKDDDDNFKVPPDNAPIEVLLKFWSKYNYSRERNKVGKPSEVVIERIFNEIEKEPLILPTYLNVLPPEKKYVEFVKDFYDEHSAKTGKSVDINYEELTKPRKSISEAIAAAEEIGRFDKASEAGKIVYPYILKNIKEWLLVNSKFYSDELLEKVKRLKVKNHYIKNSGTLVALAKVDWEKAEPYLEDLSEIEGQPAVTALIHWAYYAHFMNIEDERSAEKYRRILQSMVADRKAADGVRELALKALTHEGDFEGRDDWYLSLLEDETLFDMGEHMGLKGFIAFMPPKKWIGKMIELVGHNSPTVHKAAVRNLTLLLGKAGDEQDKLILKALLPWLSDRNWANTTEGRNKLIAAYGRIKIPESVPALILIIQNETYEFEQQLLKNSENSNSTGAARRARDRMIKAANTVSNASSKNTNVYKRKRLSRTQMQAIEALEIYKDARAVPALQNVLAETTESYQRRVIIETIINSGGFGLNQQNIAVEAIIRKIIKDNSINSVDEAYFGSFNEPYNSNEEIGNILIKENKPSDELVRSTIEKAKTFKKTEPNVAELYEQVLQEWESKVADVERLNSINNNTADLRTIIKALADRKDLQKNHRNQLYAMIGSEGVAGGIAACLLEDQNAVLNAANSSNINTKVAAYACARLLRMPIPLEATANLINSPNPLVSLAAERYLIAEDSYKARGLILAKYPGEAKILGARHSFLPNKKGTFNHLPVSELFASIQTGMYFYDMKLGNLDKAQEKLQEEVKTNDDILGVYAFLQDNSYGHKILRIYKDKAVYSWYEDDARFRERTVDQDELKLIFDYVTDNRIEDLNPILSTCHHGCPTKEFVMFGRNGGRRVYIYAGYYSQPLFGLEMIFNALEQGKSKLRYKLQDKIAGLEIILDEKNIKALSLWKNGEDFRVLVLDEEQKELINKEINEQNTQARKPLEKLDFDDNWEEYSRRSKEIYTEISRIRSERKHEPYNWRSVKGNKLGETVSVPAGDFTISKDGTFPEVKTLDKPISVWNARNSQFELRSGDYNNDGLWKVFSNGLTAKVTKEPYSNRIVLSENGKWALVTKYDKTESVTSTYRLNLQTGKEYKIDIKYAISPQPIAYINSQNKFVIYSGSFDDYTEYDVYMVNELKKDIKKEDLKFYKAAYYLLDAETGSLQPIKGEFAPLRQIKHRNLQATSNADEFWAAIPDKKLKQTRLGRYSTKTFKFTEVMKIPELTLTSMDIWVDEKESKLFFIYEGHLLGLPFPKKSS